MTATEKQLLANVLDALDPLFDNRMAVVDTWSLLLATAEALRDTQHYAKLFEPTVELIQIVRLESNSDVQRDRALDATNHLRHYLAGLLPLD